MMFAHLNFAAIIASLALTVWSLPSDGRQVARQSTSTFTNPVIWEDLADNDVFRVDDTYYYTASTMHYSPGAPILRSYDLVNWEFIGHAVPSLSWSSKYNLTNGQQAYVKGIYASSMRYRKSNNMWYWIGCIEYTTTYVYTAPAVTGPWSLSSTINTCYYDCGILIDDDDTMYVVYGGTNVNVAQLSANGLTQVKTQQVLTSTGTSIGTIEGNRFYKRNGVYYIANDRPADAEFVWKATSIWGPYTYKALAVGLTPPISGAGNPHQGSLVDTPSGAWYYMSFIDSYPGGRLPVLAPISWGSDGFPTLQTVNGGFGASYPYPATPHTMPSLIGTDSFSGTSLGVQWEWNHNPDPTKYSVNNGLTLKTATVTSDLYAARNTLTHRIVGPIGTATIVLDSTNMADGDRAGLALFRDQSAWVGVRRDGTAYTVAMVNNLIQNTSTWATTSTGTTVASATVSKGKIWLRIKADIAPGGSKSGTFYYSTDGTNFVQIGSTFALYTDWHYFMGYRWGIFNYATKALGGSVLVPSFTAS